MELERQVGRWAGRNLGLTLEILGPQSHYTEPPIRASQQKSQQTKRTDRDRLARPNHLLRLLDRATRQSHQALTQKSGAEGPDANCRPRRETSRASRQRSCLRAWRGACERSLLSAAERHEREARRGTRGTGRRRSGQRKEEKRE